MPESIKLADQDDRYPVTIGQHVGGFILTEKKANRDGPQSANGAMQDRTFIEWDKDDND